MQPTHTFSNLYLIYSCTKLLPMGAFPLKEEKKVCRYTDTERADYHPRRRPLSAGGEGSVIRIKASFL